MAWYEHLFQTLFRVLFMLLDWIVYTFVRVFYNLFDAISGIRLFSNTADGTGGVSLVQEVAERLYVLIGVYALFKVVFVLINMMVNPSDGSKGEKSIGKLATRMFVMLALIILVPWIFEEAYTFQNIIMDENVIGKIILPDKYSGDDSSGVDIGHNISNQLFASFVSISPEAMEDPDLNVSDIDDIDVETILNSDAKDKCAEPLQALMELYGQADTEESDTNVGVSTMFGHITTTFEDSETEKNEYCINYNFLISTLAGGFAAFIFAIYCLDIGVRVAKLAFYELIAPIPIVSYIDGKKDGPFQRWAKDAAKAYADIFIRLIIINFVLFLITEALPELLKIESITKHDMTTQFFAKAVVILGLLMFAKQAPQLFMDLFGIKGGGNSFSFSPKAAQEKIAGVIGGTAVLAGAGAAGALIGGGAAALGKAATAPVSGVARMAFNKDARAKGIKSNIAQSFENAGVRARASKSEALARLQTKNYNDKGVYNRQVLGKNVASQTSYGRDAGIGGILSSAQNKAMNQLSMQAPDATTKGIKRSKGLSITFGNMASQLSDKVNENKRAYNSALQNSYSPDAAVRMAALQDMANLEASNKWDATKNWQAEAVSIFEDAFRGSNYTFDKDFKGQNLPNPNDEKAWAEYGDLMQNAANNIANSTIYNDAEKEQLMKQAQAFANKLNEQEKMIFNKNK